MTSKTKRARHTLEFKLEAVKPDKGWLTRIRRDAPSFSREKTLPILVGAKRRLTSREAVVAMADAFLREVVSYFDYAIAIRRLIAIVVHEDTKLAPMKTRLLPADPSIGTPPGFPDAAELAVLRALGRRLSTRETAERYLSECRAPGASSCGALGRIRRQPRELAELFEIQADERAIAPLRRLPRPKPTISDDVGLWLGVRLMAARHAAGIDTLADPTVRVAWAGGCAAYRGILCAVVPWEQLRRSNEAGSSQ